MSNNQQTPQTTGERPEQEDPVLVFARFENEIGNLVMDMLFRLRDAHDEILALRKRNEQLEAAIGDMKQERADGGNRRLKAV